MSEECSHRYHEPDSCPVLLNKRLAEVEKDAKDTYLGGWNDALEEVRRENVDPEKKWEERLDIRATLLEVESRVQEAEGRLRDFVAEALERGEKDRPFIIGVQEFLSEKKSSVKVEKRAEEADKVIEAVRNIICDHRYQVDGKCLVCGALKK